MAQVDSFILYEVHIKSYIKSFATITVDVFTGNMNLNTYVFRIHEI